MKTSLKVLLVPVLACLAEGALAQNVLFDDVQVPPQFPQPEGKAVASLHVNADVMAGMMTTNNVYRDASRLSSEATLLAASTSVASNGERHMIIGTLEHFSQDFRDDAFQDMDLDANKVTLFGRFVTSELTNLRLLYMNEEDILGKSQSDQLNSFTSGIETSERVEAIYEIDNKRYFANIMGRNDKVDSMTSSGAQNDTLNRNERDYIVLGGRYFDWGRAFFFGGTQAVRYESGTTPTLAARNSDENRYGIGAEYQVGKFSGDVDVYRFTQRFRGAAIPDINDEWVGSGLLNYAATDSIALLVSADRRFHETNIPNSGGIFSGNVFVGASWSIAENLYLRAGPSFNRTEIQNTPIVIDRYELDVELGWNIRSHVQMLLSTNIFSQEASNPAFSNFHTQQTSSMLSLRLAL